MTVMAVTGSAPWYTFLVPRCGGEAVVVAALLITEHV